MITPVMGTATRCAIGFAHNCRMPSLRLIPVCRGPAFSVLLGACAVLSPPPAPTAAAPSPVAVPAPAAAAPLTQRPQEVKAPAAPAKAQPLAAKTPAPAAPSKPPAAASKPPSAVAAAPATPATPPIDLKSLEVKLKESKAIGLMTKLSLKNQVDDLVAKFKAFHDGRRPPTLPDLRQPYELLLMKVLSLVQDEDPGLAKALHDSRDHIWSVLADRDKFLKNI